MIFHRRPHTSALPGFGPAAALFVTVLGCCLLWGGLRGAAAGDPPDDLGAWLRNMVVPVEAPVIGRTDDKVLLGTEGQTLRPGTRLNVFREGEQFRHPVTGAVMGRLQSEVGRIEIVGDAETGFFGKPVAGSVETGDIARLTAAPLDLVLTYPAGTNPVILDEVFRSLRAVNRFEVRDGGSVGDQSGSSQKAVPGDDLILYVQSDRNSIHGSVFWADAPEPWETVTIPRIRQGAAGPGPAASVPGTPEGPIPSLGVPPFGEERIPWVHFPLPHKALLMAAGDLDGDGSEELLVHQGSRLQVYRADRLEIRPVGDISLKDTGEPFSLGVADLNGDGNGEIFLTTVNGQGEVNVETGRAETQGPGPGTTVTVLEREGGGGYREVWSAQNLLVRIVEGTVYAQEFSPTEGPSGIIAYLKRVPEGYTLGDPLPFLPQAVNLFDFVPLGENTVVYTADHRIALVDGSGAVAWTTETTFGISRFHYIVQTTPYSVPERIMRIIPGVSDASGRLLFAPRNISMATILRSSVVIRSSELLAVDLAGGEILQKGDEGSLGGEILDVVRLQDGRIAVLMAPILGATTNIFDRWDYFTGRSAIVLVEPGRI